MAASCLSLVTLYGTILRRSLSSAGLSSQTIEIDHETTIHFWAPRPNATTNSKPPLILIHGFGPHGVWQWRQQIVFFAPSFDLYIPDLVFFGGSFTKSSERSEVFQAASIGKLMEKVGVKRYYVVGTSYGGFVAYHMAAMWPERVEKVVIASSGVNGTLKDNLDLVKRANMEKIDDLILPETAAQLRTLMDLSLFWRPPYVPDFLLNDFLHKMYGQNRKEKVELLKGLTIGWDDTIKTSPLQQEVLLIWGDHDYIFRLEKATELKELLGKKVRLQVIKNTSHVPQLENAWQFNNIINNFLRGSSNQFLINMAKL